MIELLKGERKKGESNNAISACNDFLRFGRGRKLTDLAEKYRGIQQGTENQPPTRSYNTLQNWSQRYGWFARAELYDAEWEQRRNVERAIVFEQEIAQDYGRVRKLVSIAEFLEGQIYEQDEGGNHQNIWVPDVKSIGSGEDAERVDIVRFNAQLLEQYRRTLDDIAKEVGGRVAKSDLTSNGKPVTSISFSDALAAVQAARRKISDG